MKTAAILVVAGLAGGAMAAPVVQWQTWLADDYAARIEFDSAGQLAQGAAVTTQFAAEGVTLAGTARANGCGWFGPGGMHGWTGNYIVTYDGSCATNGVADAVSMKLAGDQTRAAFKARVDDYHQTGRLELLDDGVVVASVNLMQAAFALPGSTIEGYDDGLYYYRSSTHRWGAIVIEGGGTVFDEIRYREGATGPVGGGYIAFDDLRYGTAQAVPEPGALALALLALGLAGVPGRRR